jgi:hypothetical protein
MVGTSWLCGDPVLLDEGEVLLGIEVLHHDGVPPIRMIAMLKRSGAAW